jgi:hypothetical protein
VKLPKPVYVVVPEQAEKKTGRIHTPALFTANKQLISEG